LDEPLIYRVLLVGIFAVAAITAAALLFVSAPYGRHLRPGWGPTLPARAGWLLMESPAVLTMAALFLISERIADPAAIAFLALWQLHYLNRTLIFPFRLRAADKRMPVTVALMAVVFNVWNGYLNGRWLFALGPERDAAWLLDPRFVAGAALFLAGMVVNHHSDGVLRRLRAPGETGYRIPAGGLFRFVSMPNYLGELLEWTGWALATWSLGGLSFAVFTAANLVPRAISNHRWYKTRFPDYPPERRAIIPFIL
jgi:steroid 5-alpha-reductase/3-oxo-5-alpha-steroid 4-dehydrogenase 1